MRAWGWINNCSHVDFNFKVYLRVNWPSQRELCRAGSVWKTEASKFKFDMTWKHWPDQLMLLIFGTGKTSMLQGTSEQCFTHQGISMKHRRQEIYSLFGKHHDHNSLSFSNLLTCESYNTFRGEMPMWIFQLKDIPWSNLAKGMLGKWDGGEHYQEMDCPAALRATWVR